MQQEKREEIQSLALLEILKYKRRGVGISMRVGKTKIALEYLTRLYNKNSNTRILVVAPKKSIFKSWKDDIDKFKKTFLSPCISYTTYISLHKQELDYDIIILDESHSLLYNHMDWLENYTGEILGLTGTPPMHSNSEKGEMISRYCPIIYTYLTDDAVNDKVLNDYRIVVHLIDLSSEKNFKVEIPGKGRFYTSEKESYDYWTHKIETAASIKTRQIVSVMRMKAMMEYKSKEIYTKSLLQELEHKTIVFANTQDQANRLCNHSYHSMNPDSEYNLDLFKKDKIDHLSCVLQLSEGVTIPNLKAGIIMHSYGGSSPQTKQRFGRLLGLSEQEMCVLHVLCYKNTVDHKKWVPEALNNLDSDKIKYKQFL